MHFLLEGVNITTNGGKEGADMKFSPVLSSERADDAALKAEYADAEDFTPARLGKAHLFFRTGLRVSYLPLDVVTRVFRRVEIVNARVGCCNNGLPMESVVLCGAEEQELVQIRLQSERMAKALLSALETACPNAQVGYVRDPEQKSAVRTV